MNTAFSKEKSAYLASLKNKFHMNDTEAQSTLGWLTHSHPGCFLQFLDSEAGQKLFSVYHNKLNSPRRPIQRHDIPEYLEMWTRKRIGMPKA